MAVSDRDEFHLTDFRMAGFLVVRGATFIGTEISPRGDVTFLFANKIANPTNGHDQTTEGLINSYPNSPEQRYDSACRAMHDLVKMKLGLAKKMAATNGG